MPIINGEKYACESCVRGHRVSNCNHEDRELKYIPPKGRPVKQCEHCRTARKSKSHHAKCDCGSKKEKKAKEKSETPPVVKQESPQLSGSPIHDYGCQCHEGEACSCGSKAEGAEMRHIKRNPQPVRSRPSLTTSGSESQLMVITNGHHGHNRHNNIHQTAGVPYPARKKHRPQTIHGPPSSKGVVPDVQSPNLQYAADDLHLDFPAGKEFYIDPASASIAETLDNGWTFDPVSSADRSSVDFTAVSAPLSLSWPELSPTGTETAFPSISALGTSPNFDYPSSHPTFQPSDLPLVSPQAATFSQTFTLDDTFTQAPGLTSTSSARSEAEFWSENNTSDTALSAYWSDTIQVRNNSNSGLNSWTVDASSTLYGEPKSFDLNSYDVSDDVWLGNMGTEPSQVTGSESTTGFYWPSENGYTS